MSWAVPEHLVYELPERRRLECEIRKISGGPGMLEVVLLAGGTNRSVQRTNMVEGTIRLSYTSGGLVTSG